MTDMMPTISFEIEKRSNVLTVVFSNGATRPCGEIEITLWQLLQEQARKFDEARAHMLAFKMESDKFLASVKSINLPQIKQDTLYKSTSKPPPIPSTTTTTASTTKDTSTDTKSSDTKSSSTSSSSSSSSSSSLPKKDKPYSEMTKEEKAEYLKKWKEQKAKEKTDASISSTSSSKQAGPSGKLP